MERWLETCTHSFPDPPTSAAVCQVVGQTAGRAQPREDALRLLRLLEEIASRDRTKAGACGELIAKLRAQLDLPLFAPQAQKKPLRGPESPHV